MQLIQLIRLIGVLGFACILTAGIGCSDKSDEDRQASADGRSARQSAELKSSAQPAAPHEVKGNVDSRIPWTPGGSDKLQGLHLRVWGLTNDDVKQLQDVVSGRRKITPRVSEIWFTTNPPRLRVDRFWDQTGPYPKNLTEFEGHAWETITFEDKPFVLYERVIVCGTQETTYTLKKLRTVFNRDGVQGARAEIGTFEKTVRIVPAPTITTVLKAGTIDIPVMSPQRCELWLKLLEEGDRVKLPERYEQAISGLRERHTIAGRTAARYVHSATLESVLRYDFVDLQTSIGLEGYLTGWAGPASYRPEWKDNYCIYRIVLFDPTPPTDVAFDVWKD
jgi:hypothetical protein